MATKQFSPAQLAAQKLFAERARSGTLKKGKRKTTRKANPGLYENINAKKKRIAAGSGEKMRKPGEPGRPTAQAFIDSAKTAKRNPTDDVEIHLGGNKYGIIRTAGDGYGGQIFTAFYAQKNKTGFGNEVQTDLIESKDFKTRKGAIAYLVAQGRKRNPEKIMQVYTVFHRGTSNVAGTVRETSPKAAKEKIANRLGIPTLTYLVARKGERLQNPDKAKPRAYVRRASQATGAPPSKRLVTRRKKALTAPAGYFPNPKTGAMMTGYQVICMHPKKHVVGIFKTMAEAKQIATAMANANNVPYAVKAVKVHKAHFAA